MDPQDEGATAKRASKHRDRGDKSPAEQQQEEAGPVLLSSSFSLCAGGALISHLSSPTKFNEAVSQEAEHQTTWESRRGVWV